MGYEHLNTNSKTKSDEIIKSRVEELVPNPREYEVTSEDKREYDVLVCEDFSTFDVCDDHSEIFSDSNDDDISSDDDAFEDIEYVEASLPYLEIASSEEENDVYQEDEEVNLEDIFQIQDIVLCEKLLSINRLIANIKSLNDNLTPDRMLKSSASFPIFEESDNSLSYLDNFHPNSRLLAIKRKIREVEKLTSIVMNDISDDSSIDPLLEEVDLFLASDNSIPSGIKNFGYDSERDIHFLEQLLIEDSIPLFENESSYSDHHDDPLFPRPPPEPPDVEFFFDSKPDVIAEEISDMLNEDEYFDPGDEIYVLANDEDDDYFPFIFVIQFFYHISSIPRIYPTMIEASRVRFDCPGSHELHILCLQLVWRNPYP
uniref:Reverse transcriptase domain-containing protein n=1 Tax=Tanacetum cinerariifolium TaxID=118510 RepID=A0A6L2N2Z5_TANCI|nr:hypothetical protein [Tanacetum cinerariifolium]